MTAGNRFAGKALLATGGGSGLAAATARRFAAEGGRVAVLDLDAERAVRNAMAAAHERLGRLDCVVNAAGHFVASPIEQLSLSDWNLMLAVHMTGTFLVCREPIPCWAQPAVARSSTSHPSQP